MQPYNNGPSPHPQQNMSSPAPLLRPPIPGARPGRRGPPQLGLSIPPSPNARPVANGASDGIPTLNAPQPRQMPKLSVVTPMGSNNAPHEGRNPRALPPLHIGTGLSASGSSDASAHSRSGSFGEVQANGSASSYHAALGFPGLQKATDPISAISQGGSEGAPSMERANSSQPLPDLDAMAAEKGRPLEVDDLDDAAWRAASARGMIEEKGSLGEGAGGAVTKCILKGGKTTFALKVCLAPYILFYPANLVSDHHNEPRPRCQKANRTRAIVQQELCQ
jgi:mitogen-activated protein kinase kinase